MDNEKIVEFTEEGRAELVREVWPELTLEQGIAKLESFIKYIVLK